MALVVVVGILRTEIVASWRQDWTQRRIRRAGAIGLAGNHAQRQTTGRLEAELNGAAAVQHSATVENCAAGPHRS
jgi:hypothetical protein